MADAPAWRPFLPAAEELLGRHPVIDGHNDLPWEIRKYAAAPGDLEAYDLRVTEADRGDTDLPRLRAGGVGGQFWSVYVPGEGPSGRAVLQLEQLDLARRMIRLKGEPDRSIEIVYTGERPGERLHEVLIGESEVLSETANPKVFRIHSEQAPALVDLAERIRRIEAAEPESLTALTQAIHHLAQVDQS